MIEAYANRFTSQPTPNTFYVATAVRYVLVEAPSRSLASRSDATSDASGAKHIGRAKSILI